MAVKLPELLDYDGAAQALGGRYTPGTIREYTRRFLERGTDYVVRRYKYGTRLVRVRLLTASGIARLAARGYATAANGQTCNEPQFRK